MHLSPSSSIMHTIEQGHLLTDFISMFDFFNFILFLIFMTLIIIKLFIKKNMSIHLAL